MVVDDTMPSTQRTSRTTATVVSMRPTIDGAAARVCSLWTCVRDVHNGTDASRPASYDALASSYSLLQSGVVNDSKANNVCESGGRRVSRSRGSLHRCEHCVGAVPEQEDHGDLQCAVRNSGCQRAGSAGGLVRVQAARFAV